MNYTRLEDKIDIFENKNENENENKNIYIPENLKSHVIFIKDDNSSKCDNISSCNLILDISFLVLYILIFAVLVIFLFHYSLVCKNKNYLLKNA